MVQWTSMREGKFAPNLLGWYNDCFYGIKNSSTFDDRFRLVEKNNYFCFSKPELELVARTMPDETAR